MTKKELQECIIFQDFYYLIVNKPAGISAQEDHSSGTSLHKLLEEYCNKKLHVVHRLDRPTSGLIVFAKKKSSAAHIGKILRDGHQHFQKKYLAAVKNPPSPEKGTLTHFLQHDKKQRKSIVHEKELEGSKIAVLNYETIAKIENYTLLLVEINSGRFHQIRSQLGAIGSPIKGDVKYGARRGNRDRSINLHALSINLPLKEVGEGMLLNASVADESVWNAFKEMLPQIGENKVEKWKKERM